MSCMAPPPNHHQPLFSISVEDRTGTPSPAIGPLGLFSKRSTFCFHFSLRGNSVLLACRYRPAGMQGRKQFSKCVHTHILPTDRPTDRPWAEISACYSLGVGVDVGLGRRRKMEMNGTAALRTFGAEENEQASNRLKQRTAISDIPTPNPRPS